MTGLLKLCILQRISSADTRLVPLPATSSPMQQTTLSLFSANDWLGLSDERNETYNEDLSYVLCHGFRGNVIPKPDSSFVCVDPRKEFLARMLK